MVFGSIVSSSLGSLSPQQALVLASVYLESAYNINDPEIALVLCHNTEMSLSHAKKDVKNNTKNPTMIEEIAITYIDLGKLLERHGRGTEARTNYKKAQKLR